MEPPVQPRRELMTFEVLPMQGGPTAPSTSQTALQPSAATPVPMSLRPELLFKQGALRRDGGTVVQEAMQALNDAANTGFRTLDLETPLRSNTQTVLLAMWLQRLGALLVAVDRVWPAEYSPDQKLRAAWRMYRTQWSGWAQRVDEAALAWMNNVITTPGGGTDVVSELGPLYGELLAAAPNAQGVGPSPQSASYYHTYADAVRKMLQRLAPDELPEESVRDEAGELQAVQDAVHTIERRVRQADQAAAAALLPSAEFLHAMQLLEERSAAPTAALGTATAAWEAQLALLRQRLDEATQGRERAQERANALQQENERLLASTSTSAANAAAMGRLRAELEQARAEAHTAKEEQATAERQHVQLQAENARLHAENERGRALQRELDAQKEMTREAAADAAEAELTLRRVQETLRTEESDRRTAQRTIDQLRAEAAKTQRQFEVLQGERDQLSAGNQALQTRVTELTVANAALTRDATLLRQEAASVEQLKAAVATERSARQLAELWLASSDMGTPLPPAAFVEYLRARAGVA